MSLDPEAERKIMHCVDQGLEALGLSGRQAIIYHLKKNLGLKKEEIPSKPELFCKGLQQILGEQGADVVSGWIVKKLLTNFKLKNRSKMTLVEIVETIRKNWAEEPHAGS